MTRLVSLAFVAYAAYALLGFDGTSGDRGAGVSVVRASPECAARRTARCEKAQARAGGIHGTEGLTHSQPKVVDLQLPQPDPQSGKPRLYSANHMFHVCEFHLHNHARLLETGDLPGNGMAMGNSGNSVDTSRDNSEVTSTTTTAKTSVVFRVPNTKWLDKLTPMTRLLLSASYTDGSVGDINFVNPTEVGLDVDINNVDSNNVDSNKNHGDAVSLRCGWVGRSFGVDTRRQPLDERFVVPSIDSQMHQCEPGVANPVLPIDSSTTASFGAVKAERGEWLPIESDVQSFRDALEGLCQETRDSFKVSKSSKRQRGDRAAKAAAAELLTQPCGDTSGDEYIKHLVIYQRNTGRVLENVPGIKKRLEEELNELETEQTKNQKTKNSKVWKVSIVTHHDRFPPCALRQCLRKATVLLTPHGFQSMLYLFLNKNTHLHEVFPHRYYKHGYKRAALEWGVSYGFSMSPPRSFFGHLISKMFTTNACMQMYYCRYLARKGDVVVTDEDLEFIARSAVVAAAQSEGSSNHAGTPQQIHTRFGDAVEWVDSSQPQTTRAECLAACAGTHACQLFSVDKGRCALRVDSAQGEKDGDTLGAGIYNNKCWVPGCR